MTINEIRYQFEHVMMPEWFFSEGMNLIGYMITQKDFAFQLMNKVCEDSGVEMPYPKELFSFRQFKTEDKILGGRIILPQPTELAGCYYILLLFNLQFDNIRYFTVEYGTKPEEILLGEWTKSGEHVIHGEVDLREEGDLKKAVEIYNGGKA